MVAAESSFRYDKNMRIIVITGDGKGKTTSALGMVLRAVGHGQRVCVVQFIKKDCDTGESRALRMLPGVDLHICGDGFVFKREGVLFQHHVECAQNAMEVLRRKIQQNYDMIVMDEICGALSLGLIELQSVLELLELADDKIAFILTGRNACKELIDIADTVSSVECVKHGFEHGIPAQKGIDF